MSRGKSSKLAKFFGKTSRSKNLGASAWNRRLRCEALEERQLLSVTLPDIAPLTVLSGAPLNVPLDTESTTGNPVNYTVSVSDSSLLTASVPQGNTFLKLTVDDEVDNIHGTMTFELFADLTPETVANITSLVNSGSYDGLTFHRIIKNFMIQGGAGASSADYAFDDEFNANLQFTGSGLLAMANSGDDTNGSGFFITTNTYRGDIPTNIINGDFNHTIFGMLVEDTGVLDQLNSVATDSSNAPLNSVVITKAEMVTNTEDGVLRIATNATSGDGTVTIRATDSVTGEYDELTINVTAAADNVNDPPFLGKIDPIVTSAGKTLTFQIPATDVEGDAIYYAGIVKSSSSGLILSVDNATGMATLTLPASLANGTYYIKLGASATSSFVLNPNADTSGVDTQVVAISIINAISLSNSSVKEGMVAGTEVGAFSTTGATSGETYTYTLVSGDGSTDNAKFTIEDDVLMTAAVFDYDTASSYSIRVRSTDSSGDYTDNIFTISVEDTSGTPSVLSLSKKSVSENKPIGTTVGTFSATDTDGNDSFVYSLVSGTGSTTNNSLFTIENNELKTAAVFDYDDGSSYTILVRVADIDGRYYDKTFPITVVSSTNAAPTGISLSSTTVVDGTTTVGTCSTTDPDAGNTFAYTLVNATASNDNGRFELTTDGVLTLKSAADCVKQKSYTIRVRSTDQDDNALYVDKDFTITVVAKPTDIALKDTNSNAVTTVLANQDVGTTVGTLSTTSKDSSDSFTYSLVSGDSGLEGADNGKFTINGSTLLTKQEFASSDIGKTYSICVRTTSVSGKLSFDKTIELTVVAGGITINSAASVTVAESVSVGASIGTLATSYTGSSSSDKYTLVSGTGSTDNSSFRIVGNVLKTNAKLDYETKTSYTVRVRCTSSDGVVQEKAIKIYVTDVNEAPTGITLTSSTISEDIGQDVEVGAFIATDPDAGAVSYTFTLVDSTANPDNNSFSIDADGILRTAKTATFDYTVQSSYSIRVRCTDQGTSGVADSGLWVEKTLTISLTKVNRAPTDIKLSSATILENQAIGTTVGTLTATDGDTGDTFTYKLVTGTGSTDNAKFTISGNSLLTAEKFTYEAGKTYAIRVRVTDSGGATHDEEFTISVINSRTSITLSKSEVLEGVPVGTAVGELKTSNLGAATDSFTYSMASGDGDTNNGLFGFDGSKLVTKAVFDYDTATSYTVRIRSKATSGQFTEKAFTITVLNGAVTLSNSTIKEAQPIGTTVGALDLSSAVSGVTYTYSLVSGDGSTDNGSFQIVGSQLKTKATLDYETKTSYFVRVRCTGSNDTTEERSFEITVTDVNESPTNLTLSNATFNEDVDKGFVVGAFTTTDPDAGANVSYTYELVSSTEYPDNTAFKLSTDGTLTTNATFDYATQSTYTIRVRTTDQGTTASDGKVTDQLWFEKTFTITLKQVTSHAPSAITLSNTVVFEKQAVGTTVGTLIATDADVGDTFTYSLVSGDGSTNNAKFKISGSTLVTSQILTYTAGETCSIRVRATDSTGRSKDATFTITVITAATSLTLSNTDIIEKKPAGTVVGTLTTLNLGKAGDTFTYKLVDGSGDGDNGLFAIDGDKLVTGVAFDYKTETTYTVRVRSTSTSGQAMENVFTLAIIDAPDIKDVSVIEGTSTINNHLETKEDLYIKWTVDDANTVGMMSLTVDDKAVTSISSSGSTTNGYGAVCGPFTAGQHTYVITATDVKGSTTSYTGTFNVEEASAAKISDVRVAESTGPQDGTLLSTEGLVISWRVTSDYTVTWKSLKIDDTSVQKIYGPYGDCYSGTFGPLAAGTHTYTISVIDSRGVTGTLTGTFVVEAGATAAAPTISGVYVGEQNTAARDGSLTTAESLVLTWGATSSSKITSQTVTIDGKATGTVYGPYGIYYSTILGTLSAGTHTYVITSKNADGQTGTYTGTVTVVASSTGTATAPTISAVYVGEKNESARDGTLTTSEPLVLTWGATSSSKIASQTVTIDGNTTGTVYGPYGIYYSTILGTLSAGDHTYIITSKSADGLTGTYTGTVTVAAAATAAAPTISAVYIGEENTGARDGTLTAAESLVLTWGTTSTSKITSQTVTVDGTAINLIYGPYGIYYSSVLGKLSAGTHTYVISAKNADGLTGTYTGTVTVVAATTTAAPTVSGVYIGEQNTAARDGTLTAAESLVLTWATTSSNKIASHTVTVDGTAVGSVLGPYGTWYADVLGKLSAGSHTYVITAIDSSGVKGTYTGSITVSSALTVDAAAKAASVAANLTESELSAITAAAIDRLVAVYGADVASKLGSLSVALTDLPSGLLGLTTGNTIAIDRDAAGYGWFVDLTPDDDAEFVDLFGGDTLSAIGGTTASERVDLLTAVMHEMGHVLGFDHSADLDLMAATLTLGERKDVC